MKKIAAMMMIACACFLLVAVVMIGCARAGGIRLAWDANDAADEVTDYRIWRGIDCLGTRKGTEATVTVPDEACVITVTARSANGESAHSVPLEIIAVTVEESTDLKSWLPVATIHGERQDKAFYRLKIETGGAR